MELEHPAVLPPAWTYVAGEHVEEEVVGGAGEGGLGEDAGGALELGGDGVEADEAGDVLDEDDEEEGVLGGQEVGALGAVEEVPDGDLRQREHGEEVDDEEAADVAPRDGGRVDHQLAAAEHPRRRRDVRRPELERDAGEVEEVDGRAHRGGARGEAAVEADAGVAVGGGDGGEVEEEWVDGDGDDAGHDEEAVHPHQERVLRVE
ncbi:Os12g0468550, partial [Oryza sativa Japonica Group]